MASIELPPHSKIALLICDPTKAEFIDSYGNITNLFTGLYTKLLIRFTENTEVSSLLPDVMKSFRVYPFYALDGQLPALSDVDQYDSIIVSGSANGVNDPEEWIEKLGTFLHTTATEHPKVKLIGICFGHQIISHAVFGKKVGANPKGWEIGPYKVTLNDTGKKLFKDADSLNVEMFHHDAVFTQSQLAFFEALCAATPYDSNVPENVAHIWGFSEKAENQGMVSLNKAADRSDKLNVDDIHVFTCQGHPELTQGMTSYLLDLFEDDIPRDDVVEARGRIANFKGILDWYRLTIIMWALSTRHSVVLSSLGSLLNELITDFPSKNESVFVLVT